MMAMASLRLVSPARSMIGCLACCRIVAVLLGPQGFRKEESLPNICRQACRRRQRNVRDTTSLPRRRWRRRHPDQRCLFVQAVCRQDGSPADFILCRGYYTEFRTRIHASQGLDHFQIIVRLMDGLDLLRTANGMGQKPSPAVGAEARPDGDPRQTSDDGGLYGVLQKNGGVEPAAAKFGGQSDFSPYPVVTSRTFEGHDLIDLGAKPVDIGHPGLARTVILASGKVRRMETMAGIVITASPIQFVPRMSSVRMSDPESFLLPRT